MAHRIQDHNLPPLLPFHANPEDFVASTIDVSVAGGHEVPSVGSLDTMLNVGKCEAEADLATACSPDVDASVWAGPIGKLYRSQVLNNSETGGMVDSPISVFDDTDDEHPSPPNSVLCPSTSVLPAVPSPLNEFREDDIGLVGDPVSVQNALETTHLGSNTWGVHPLMASCPAYRPSL